MGKAPRPAMGGPNGYGIEEAARMLGNRAFDERKADLALIRVIANHNPRGRFTGEAAFDPEQLAALADSIRRHGDVLHPIIVRKAGAYYEIAAGERRFRAARLAGLTEVSVNVLELTDEEMITVALEENEHQQSVSKVDTILYKLTGIIEYAGLARENDGDRAAPQEESPEQRLYRRVRYRMVRLRDHPDAFPDDSPEGRLKTAIALYRAPTVHTLLRAWTSFLLLREEELDAVRSGLAEEAVLALLQLGERSERRTLLAQAREEKWTAPQMREAVKAVLQPPSPVHRRSIKDINDAVKKVRKHLKTLSADQQDALIGDVLAVIDARLGGERQDA